MFGAPDPRYRIYTKPASYATVLSSLLDPGIHGEPRLREVEQDICKRAGVKYGLFMPTARTAIYATLASLIRPGQKVLMSPITIVDVVNMVLSAGGIPTFVDVDKNTCNIRADALERRIDKNAGAVLVTHLHGLACDIERIRADYARKPMCRSSRTRRNRFPRR